MCGSGRKLAGGSFRREGEVRCRSEFSVSQATHLRANLLASGLLFGETPATSPSVQLQSLPRRPERIGARAGTVCVALRYRLNRVAVGHDHDHRLRFTRCDQIVQDHVGAAHREPRGFVAATAVQQIKDGVTGLSGLVARRRVDRYPAAVLLQGGRGLPHEMSGPVRNVLKVP